jgi:hypothetical protein
VIAYKLFRMRRDGSLGSLFINRRARLPVGFWMGSQLYPTKGFAERCGWHCLAKPEAPHLSEKGRRWFEVEMDGEIQTIYRPASQGGVWYLAEFICITRIL